MQRNPVWTTAYVNQLPDSAFLYIGHGGEQGDDGRTRPLSLRKLPYKDRSGKVSLAHLRNAISRLPMTDIDENLKPSIKRRACKLLQQHGGECSSMAANAHTQCWKLKRRLGDRSHVIYDDRTGKDLFAQLLDDDGALQWYDQTSGDEVEGRLRAEIEAFASCGGGHPHIEHDGIELKDLPHRLGGGSREEMAANMDIRRRAGLEQKYRRQKFDQQKMTITVVVIDEDSEDEDEEVELELPVKLEVCGVCEGRGKYVNPSIDEGGLSREDFDDDPDFAEDYFGGRYDVTCENCGGLRVEPVVDERYMGSWPAETKRLYKMWQEQEEREAAYDREAEDERRMGY